MSKVTKHPFLVCYDYGQGGLWAFVDARSEGEIHELYPELTIIHQRPQWMSDDEFDRISTTEHHDIDGQPFGVLNVLLADRNRE